MFDDRRICTLLSFSIIFLQLERLPQRYSEARCPCVHDDRQSLTSIQLLLLVLKIVVLTLSVFALAQITVFFEI